MKKLMNQWIKIIYFCFLFLLAVSIVACANMQLNSNEQKKYALNWLPYNQGLEKSIQDNKHSLIYFYSDSCGYCRKLEDETFSSTDVRQLLSKSFVIIRINSHSSEKVIENGQEIPESQLIQVYQVGGYPTVWFLDEKNQPIATLPGYVPSDVFIDVLNYIKGDFYKEITFQEYLQKEDQE
jgi:thioredoxin-related protein